MFKEKRLIQKEINNEEALEKLLNNPGHGACGIAAIQSANGASREVVDLLLEGLCDNDIRAGKILDSTGWPVGDGAGIMLRTDNCEAGRGMQQYLHEKAGAPSYDPRHQTLSGGLFFIDRTHRGSIQQIKEKIGRILQSNGLTPLRFERATVNPEAISGRAQEVMPDIYQLTFAEENEKSAKSVKALFNARLEIEKRLPGVFPVSLQAGVMTWKGMCRGSELANLYPDLRRPDVITDAGIIHTRFGTNTLARWSIAQPFGVIVHNGEVNSIRKILKVLENLERMHALPGSNIMRNASDSANLDRAIQFLQAKGLSLEESVRWMIHPPLDDLARMRDDVREYFIGISRAMGSLKAIGPIALLGMDRNKIIAALDNMGLRPLRIIQRADGMHIIASEVGMPNVDDIVKYDRLGPGEMVKLDRKSHLTTPDQTNKELVASTPVNYKSIAEGKLLELKTGGKDQDHITKIQEGMEGQNPPETYIQRAHLFGLNTDRQRRIKLSVEESKDPIEGMGSDLAMACFSPEPNSMGRFIITNWSQVSNPSLDYTREKGPFTTETHLGARPQEKKGKPFQYETNPQYKLADPLLDYDQMTALYATDKRHNPTRKTISTVYAEQTLGSCEKRIEEIKSEVIASAKDKKHAIIVLSDRKATGKGDGYIPPHVLVAYLSRELDKLGLSSGVSLVVDTGEALDQHEFNTLIACGAKAVHPRLIYEQIRNEDLKTKGKTKTDIEKAIRKSFHSTLLRYMAKLGLTEIDSYRGSQQFSTLGLSEEFIRKYFRDEVETNGGGMTFEALLKMQWSRANEDLESPRRRIRKSEEKHGFGTAIMKSLQKVGGNIIEEDSDLVKIGKIEEMDDERINELMPAVMEHERGLHESYKSEIKKEGILSARDVYRFKKRDAIPIEEVMSTDEIIRRVIRGAGISLGAVNDQAHRAIHMLFNYYGSMANSGEGGVPKDRGPGQPWEVARCKSIQTASGRFGIDIESLANPQVEEIEIKIGQGAKPGVGGHLPGKKAFPLVATIRGVSLGQELISPPTNHDIYSIEDLEGLIERLGACNPTAKISVKLTSGPNVGTIAAGCSKADAFKVQVSGGAGGTGAATFTDKFNTGTPVEFGLSDADKTFVEQGLRDKTELGADGGIRTGEDILKLILMGANTVSLGTMLLIAQLKCIFCQNCSTQKCPAYITRSISKFLGSSRDKKDGKKEYDLSQEDAQLHRLLYNGMRTLEFLAQEIRELMAKMGVRTIEELIGKRGEFLELDPEAIKEYPWLKDNFNHDKFLAKPEPIFNNVPKDPPEAKEPQEIPTYDPESVEYYLNSPKVNMANREIIRQVIAGIRDGDNPINVELHDIRPKDRNLGATLGCLIVRKIIKLPEKGIVIRTLGKAGQGYGTGVTKGVTMIHTGPIQNEGGAFQNGGKIVILSPLADQNKQVLLGNTLSYGGRGGDRFIQGSVGDRTCVRETFGRTIITGNTGKYFAGYKTGGRDIVLGTLGYDIGAGMSGGAIYTRDPNAEEKLADGATVTTIMRSRDLEIIKSDLEEFYADTRDAEVGEILANWNKEKHKFKKIVAESQYATGIFNLAFTKISRAHGASAQEDEESGSASPEPYELTDEEYPEENMEELMADLYEMCGFDIDAIESGLIREQIKSLLEMGFKRLIKEILPNVRPTSEEAQFMATREFCFEMSEGIKAYIKRVHK